MFDNQAGDVWGSGTPEYVVSQTQILLNLFLSYSAERSPDLIVLLLGAAFSLLIYQIFEIQQKENRGNIELNEGVERGSRPIAATSAPNNTRMAARPDTTSKSAE